jgi:acid phosphatase (class A)
MKRILIPVFLMFAAFGASAQNNTVPGKTDIEQQEYLKTEEVPNSLYILPVHPEFNSVQFLNDQFQYYWGKNLRNTERGQQAISDVTLDGLQGMNNAFGEVFGTPITLENAPEIFTLVRSIGRDAGGIAPKAAKTITRGRARLYSSMTTPAHQTRRNTCATAVRIRRDTVAMVLQRL